MSLCAADGRERGVEGEAGSGLRLPRAGDRGDGGPAVEGGVQVVFGEVRGSLQAQCRGADLPPRPAWWSGGHVAQMARSAEAVCGVYPELNRDLLVAGVVFHDSGKLWENCYLESGFTMPYTLPAELLGHIPDGDRAGEQAMAGDVGGRGSVRGCGRRWSRRRRRCGCTCCT